MTYLLCIVLHVVCVAECLTFDIKLAILFLILSHIFHFQVELFTAPIQKKEANEKLRMPAFLAKEVKCNLYGHSVTDSA